VTNLICHLIKKVKLDEEKNWRIINMSVNAGIIGFGYMGHFHLNKIKQIEGIKVIAAFDNLEQKLEEADKEGIKGYHTLEEFLAVEEMNLVIICTPNNWHSQYAIAALNAGKHVLCEKPATMSVVELEDIIRCSENNNKIFTVHQNRRWDVDYKIVRDVVENKMIGQITTIESKVFGERGVCFGWRADPVAGGGMLYDWGVHLIDQMLQLFAGQKVKSVHARILSILTPVVDDYFEIEMIFDSGVCARVMVGTFALQKLPRWFVFGDRGTLKLDDFSGKTGGMARIKGNVEGFDSVIGKKSLGPSRTMAPLESQHLEKLELPTAEEEPLTFWVNLVDSIENGTSQYVKSEEVMRQMKVVEAAFLSYKKNEVIKVCI